MDNGNGGNDCSSDVLPVLLLMFMLLASVRLIDDAPLGLALSSLSALWCASATRPIEAMK